MASDPSMASALEVGSTLRGVKVNAIFWAGGTQVAVSAGSVVQFSGDAIVNAANTGGLGGGGVDGAVNAAGGRDLVKAREALPVSPEGERIPVGEARATVAGRLQAKWVVHAVGPIFRSAEGGDFSECDDLLHNAYANSLRAAAEHNVSTIGFSLLSAGIFRGGRPLINVLEIACEAIKDNVYEGLTEVHLVAFTAEEQRVLLEAARKVFASPAEGRSASEEPSVAQEVATAPPNGNSEELAEPEAKRPRVFPSCELM
ncbi:unnamed protein product [Polarella glacialis]|uniref:Macro domain-containing protein n=1 Tax=Polarella glacialis TaxID=89957 RepID=A0A813KK45_POLGL|nr:unnamed protein product [Polarella glacialis]